MRASFSLFELNEYIKRVIALNFPEPIWVHAEISQWKDVRGNVYLDLVCHDEKNGEVNAQLSATIWYKSFLFIKAKLGNLLPSILCEGSQVLLKVQVDFHERYGLKLTIEDIDPSYTIGLMEMNRQKILQRLQDENLVEKNKASRMPLVAQRIAVISSENAAGYIDFIKHLQENVYGYAFSVTLFQAAMQGQNTEKEVCQALRSISSQSDKFDCIAIIRGGGSKMDLSWFDNYAIGAAIAQSPVPVLTGIGHDIDSTVADVVSHMSCKTPTAVADFIVQKATELESRVQQLTRLVTRTATQTLSGKQKELQQITYLLLMAPGKTIQSHYLNIHHILEKVRKESSHAISAHKQRILQISTTLDLLNPRQTLRRGYAIVRQNDKVVSQTADFQANSLTEIEFIDGKIQIPAS